MQRAKDVLTWQSSIRGSIHCLKTDAGGARDASQRALISRRKGNIALPLQSLRQASADPEGCNDFERGLLKDLEIVQKYMQRVMGKSSDRRL